jgi:putative selenium metabolism protein SsnA
MSLLLKNVTAVILHPPSIERCDLRIADGDIVARSSTLRNDRDDEVVDLAGLVVMPGFVCSHTHLYSALSRGMPPPASAPGNFLQILNRIWWNLDVALDEEAIHTSALVGAIEAVKLGTTTLVDHHASPNCIRGSLDLVKDALSRVGVRGVLCYETTDRGGKRRRNLGLDENERFVTENASQRHFRGTIGAHASFTLSDDSLRRLGELARLYDCGVHIHVAEDRADVLHAKKNCRVDLVRRLTESGVLSRKSIAVHGVHLTKAQLAEVEKVGAWVVHNPRSNMNNGVGSAPLSWFGERSALGTDGFPADMFEESKIGYFRNAESPYRTEFSKLPVMVQNGQRLAGEFFGRPFGTLGVGSPADLVALEYIAPTPMRKDNLHGHFLFGMSAAAVRHVMVDGRWIVWNRQIVGLDEDAVMQRARRVAQRLWTRMRKS